jgi:hypothetical protein
LLVSVFSLPSPTTDYLTLIINLFYIPPASYALLHNAYNAVREFDCITALKLSLLRINLE